MSSQPEPNQPPQRFDFKVLIPPAVTGVITALIAILTYSCSTGKDIGGLQTSVTDLKATVTKDEGDWKSDSKAQADRMDAEIKALGQTQSTALAEFKTQSDKVIVKLDKSVTDLNSEIAKLRDEADKTTTELKNLQGTVANINSAPLKDLKEFASQITAAAERIQSSKAGGSGAYIQILLQHKEGVMTDDSVYVQSPLSPPIPDVQLFRTRLSIVSIGLLDTRSESKIPQTLQSSASIMKRDMCLIQFRNGGDPKLINAWLSGNSLVVGMQLTISGE